MTHKHDQTARRIRPRTQLPRRAPLLLSGWMLLGGVLLVMLAPLLATHDPLAINYAALAQPPSRQHWLGTDDLGRDMFSRLVWGGRTSLLLSLLANGCAFVMGTALGMLAGYCGGWADRLIGSMLNVWLALPEVLLLLCLVVLFGPGISTLIVAIGVVLTPIYARLVRGTLLTVLHADYVVGAVAIGAHTRWIVTRHLLPHMRLALLIYGSTQFGTALWMVAGLSFLGLGPPPPTPEWGAMIAAGLPYLRAAWWITTLPGVAIFSTLLMTTLLVEGLQPGRD